MLVHKMRSSWALPRRQIAGVDRTRHSSIVHTPGGYGERAAKWAAFRHQTDGEVRLARWTSLTLLQLKATWWLEPARFISSVFQKLWKPMWVWAGREIFYAGKRSPQGQQVTKVPRFSLTTIQESPHRYQEQSSSIILWTWSGHNCECSLASPDAHQSLHTNAELKTVTKLWNIQRLAQMHRSLHMHNRRTRDKTQHGTNCMNCLILRQNYLWWDRLYITTQATKVLPWAHKTARLGTQLSNIHASPDAFTNYLTHLSSPIFPESESMCAETSLACAHRRIHFKVTEV